MHSMGGRERKEPILVGDTLNPPTHLATMHASSYILTYSLTSPSFSSLSIFHHSNSNSNSNSMVKVVDTNIFGQATSPENAAQDMRPLSLEMNHMSNMNGRIVGHEMMNNQHQQQQQHQKNSNVSNGQQDQENNSNNSNECSVREQDRFMPIANVIRIMRKILPPHAKISDDAKETIQECVSEYISFITGEANERCQREQRKTITAEDVLWAMSKLGFDDYIEPLTLYLHRYRELDGDRGGSIRATCDQLRSRSAMDQYAAAFGPPVFHIGPPPPHPHPPAAYYGGSSSACTDYLKEQPASAPPTHSHSHSHSAAPPANSVSSYAPFAHHN